METVTAIFEGERGRLLGLAYGFLGSHSEAEDVVQEAWLRYDEAAAALLQPEAWLTTVVSRIALDRLRSAQRRRETYPGVWLPEPVSELPDPESAESTRSLLSLGFLHLLEILSPEERAAVVLREAFERSYQEIAAIIGKPEAACRQLLSRARRRLKQERAGRLGPVPETVVQEFIDALASSDEQRILALLADDAVLFSDGGGRVRAALNPIVGASKIARFFTGLLRKYSDQYSAQMIRANGAPAVLAVADAGGSVLGFGFDGARITAMYLIRNPDKLSDFPYGGSSNLEPGPCYFDK